jgi:hypothetical protein
LLAKVEAEHSVLVGSTPEEFSEMSSLTPSSLGAAGQTVGKTHRHIKTLPRPHHAVLHVHASKAPDLMSSSNSVRTLFRGSRALSIRNGPHAPRRRCLATAAAPASETLPLAGMRVLDMTRVLAGVSKYYFRPTWLCRGVANGCTQPYCTQILGDLGYAA